MPTLSETQSLFWNAITDGVSANALQGSIAPSARMTAVQRVQVYANMYADRLVDALAADFPNLAKALGHEVFHPLMQDYLAAHPSEQPSISYVGQHLVAYLRTHAARLPRPDLADLAALEWTRSMVFEAPAGPCVAATELTRLAEEQLPAARFEFVLAMQCIESQFDTEALWRALEEDDPVLPEAAVCPSTLVVWRPEFTVYHTRLSAEAAAALRRAQAKAPLEEVCEAFAALPNPVQTAFAAIGAWFADGWVRAISV